MSRETEASHMSKFKIQDCFLLSFYRTQEAAEQLSIWLIEKFYLPLFVHAWLPSLLFLSSIYVPTCCIWNGLRILMDRRLKRNASLLNNHF